MSAGGIRVVMSEASAVVRPARQLPSAVIPFACCPAYLHARDWRAGGKILKNDNSTFAFVTEPNVGWVRMLIAIPSSAEGSGHLLFHFLPGSEIPADLSVGIGSFDERGSFAVSHRYKLTKPVVPSNNHPVGFTLPEGVLRSLRENLPPSGTLFAFLELHGKCKINLRSIEVIFGRLDQHGVPLRLSSLAIFKDLSDLNDKLPNVTKPGLVQWLLKEAAIAVRLECFETAKGILQQLGDGDDLTGDHLKLFLKIYTEVAIAEGRVEDVRAVLTKHLEVVAADDELWTGYSTCFPATEEFFQEFGRLPSGKLNRFFLSRLPPAKPLLLAKAVAATKTAEADWLLLASQLRTSVPSAYLSYWNKYLQSQNLAPLSSVDLSAENVLSSLSFAEHPQVTDGPLVSVLMSAHNSEKTIDYAVRSIVGQSYRNLELLICDDASTDSTAKLLAQWQGHPQVRLFRSSANQGTYNVRNCLIQNARGKYLTFQDSDDFAHPQRLERQLAAIATSGGPVVIGRWIRVRPDGEVVFFRDQQCIRMSVVSIFAETDFFRREQYRSVACAADTEFLENVRVHSGPHSVFQMPQSVIFGLWSDQSMTRQSGLEASEDGYRSVARRAYAEIAARQRMLGKAIVQDATVEDVLRIAGIARKAAGVVDWRAHEVAAKLRPAAKKPAARSRARSGARG